MSTQVQTRRGTTAEHSTFTGAVGELTVDTTKDTVVVHDGATAGGRALLREDQSNLPTSAPTTGLYNNSGALALSTNGTGRLFVDASGNVGVGAASTGAYFRALGVTGASIIEAYGADFDGNADVEIKSNGTAGYSRLLFSDTAAQSGIIRYSHNSNSLEFSTAGSEKLRIDSSGRFLVGTSSSRSINGLQHVFQIEGTTLAGSSLSVMNNTNDQNPPFLTLGKSKGGALGSVASVAADTGLGAIAFMGGDGTSLLEAATIKCFVDGTPGTNDMPTRLVFSTTADGASSPTERMRIGSDGQTLITAAPTTAVIPTLKLTNSKNVSGDLGFVNNLGSNCNNTSSYHAIFATGGADKYYIYGNGATGTPSDINLKKNIETTRDGYLEDLCQLRVVKYNWNEQADGEPKELGIIAQELEQVFPGLIQQGPKREDGSFYKSVKTSVLPFMLLKALQEAAAKIETLEAKVAALENA